MILFSDIDGENENRGPVYGWINRRNTDLHSPHPASISTRAGRKPQAHSSTVLHGLHSPPCKHFDRRRVLIYILYLKHTQWSLSEVQIKRLMLETDGEECEME